jgi:hypothetical protein
MRAALGIFVLVAVGVAYTEEANPPQLRSGVATLLSPEELAATGEIYFAGVRAPLGAFVLAKRGRNRCAIKIEKFWGEGEGQPPSAWHGGGPKQFASYVSYYRDDGNDHLLADKYRSASGTLSRLPHVGPGRLAVARGVRHANCGKLELHWSYPNWIEFYGISGLEFAITKITDPEHIHFDAPELRWVSEDPDGVRPPEVLSRASLCCEVNKPATSGAGRCQRNSRSRGRCNSAHGNPHLPIECPNQAGGC